MPNISPHPLDRPAYTITEERRDGISTAGTLRVDNPADLAAAMAAWKASQAGYEPRIYADKADPCLAYWSRWNTCE